MLLNIRPTLLLVALLATTPVMVQSPVRAADANCCCQQCQRPVARCCCRAPAQAALQPVVETQYAQQPVLQQRDVTTTEYRQEPVVQSVPTTVYENVTVDEGGYQTVWVPKLTTKAVARTVYQNQTAYRTVPYQVTRRVAECVTQTVPYQTVRYVPYGSSLAYSSVPGTAVAVAPSSSAPLAANPPLSTSSLAYRGAVIPVPDPKYATPTAIAPRRVPSSSDLNAEDSIRSADRSSGLFAPAPSAAQVWRTPRGSLVR
ncbi:MAG: hypothetical protein ACKV0T_01620 [Planctomycetales bacterium]